MMKHAHTTHCPRKASTTACGMLRANIALAAALLAVAGSASVTSAEERAAETLSVSFTTTITVAPEYGLKNVVAAWVEDSGGTFVKTIGRWAGVRWDSLVNWKAKAGYDTDAVTGATRRDHSGTLNVTWDMTNRVGQTVSDGTYRVVLELADRDKPSAGDNNLGTFTFAKNGTSSSQNTSGGRFYNVSIDYNGRPVPTYTLAANAGTGGQITQPATSPGTYDENDVVTIQASPAAGYAFAGWTGSANIADPSNALTTVTMLADTTVTAAFTDLNEQFDVSPTSATVPEGGSTDITVALTAQPTGTVTANVAYASGDTDISAATRAQLQFTTGTWATPQTVSITASEDADTANGVAVLRLTDAAGNLTAVDLTFTESDDDRVLTLAADPAGGGVVSPVGATVHEGSPAAVIDIAATPAVGWLFVEWTGDVQQVADTQAADTTVTMQASYSLTASFTPNPDDQDADGLSDTWETTHFTDINAQDGTGNPDGDLLANAAEHAAGSDPTKTTLVVTAGWNLVAVPTAPAPDTTYADQLSGLTYSSVWGWNGTAYYDLSEAPAGQDVLQPLNAYWVYAVADGWTDVDGTGFPAGERDVAAGWNLVGPILGGPFSLPADVFPPLWTWDGLRYTVVTDLQPTRGLWMFCTAPTTVTLP